MALIKEFRRLSYWRTSKWSRSSEGRFDIVVEGFFSPETRAKYPLPDETIIATLQIPDPLQFPSGIQTIRDLDYWLLRNATFEGVMVWSDAVDYFDDPWATPEATE